ncbi:hypothetical protein AX16_006670 [Volvariella volvacea WC 439]|nr:hypothetical protein AX16_006670 [Volvariella volvacea WC 439]
MALRHSLSPTYSQALESSTLPWKTRFNTPRLGFEKSDGRTITMIFRPLARSMMFTRPCGVGPVRSAPLALRMNINANAFRTQNPGLLSNPILLRSTLLHARTVASSVSGRPASQTFEHAKTNIQEELGNSATDLAKAIAGANVTADNIGPGGTSFIGITSQIAHEVPKPALVFGLLGGLPYVAASAMTVYLARNAGAAAVATASGIHIDPGVALNLFEQALNIQVTYGAVMLSFLGALHWGMEFAGYGGQKGWPRLLLGVTPALYAWPTLALEPMMALTAQWVGFTALWYADSKATMNGWAPKWFSQYRFYLSILVGTCIIGSLAGTSFWGPVAGHGFLSHDLDLIREERLKRMPEKVGMIAGPVEAVPAGADADHYVRIHRKNLHKSSE